MDPIRPIAVVTGANGFVGSHLVDYLLEKNYEVHAIVRGSGNLRWLEGRAVQLWKCGLDDVEALRPIMQQAHYIYHIAGTVKSRDAEGFRRGNVAPTRHVLEAALGAPNLRRIVVTSSLAAASPSRPGSPVHEGIPSAPLTAYGRSKVEQEQLCHAYMDRLPITLVRPPVVFGERDTEVLLFFKTVRRGLLPMIGFDDKTLSLVYVRDLVRGMEQAATAEIARSETYFLGSEREYTWVELGRAVGGAIGKNPFAVRVPHAVVHVTAALSEFLAGLRREAATLNREKAREMVQPSWACSSEKARAHFGYREEHSLTENMHRTAQWYLAEHWL
jgi:dihydroflavonol-4-reductase